MTWQNPLLPAPAAEPNTTPPAATTGLTESDLARLRPSLDSSVSDNTQAMYSSNWKGFESWAQVRGALTMPASSPLVAACLSHLVEERHFSVATVRRYRAALAAIHRTNGHADPTDNEGVQRVLKGIARAHGRAAKQAKPLITEALAAVRATAPNRRPWGREEAEVSRESFLEGPGGPGAALRPQGRPPAPLRGRGPHLG